MIRCYIFISFFWLFLFSTFSLSHEVGLVHKCFDSKISKDTFDWLNVKSTEFFLSWYLCWEGERRTSYDSTSQLNVRLIDRELWLQCQNQLSPYTGNWCSYKLLAFYIWHAVSFRTWMNCLLEIMTITITLFKCVRVN